MTPGARTSKLDETDINFMETKLEKLLSLRQANPEFVQKLKTRLTYEPLTTLETQKTYKAIWIIAAALFSGGLLIFILSLIFGRNGKTAV